MINDFEATRPITTDAYIPSVDLKNRAISTLNSLIAICKDGEEGFKEAAENVERVDLKSLFNEFSAQRSQFASGLTSLVESLGGNAADSGHLAASLHRVWIDVKGTFTGKDDGAALNECERGEDSAKNAFKEALEEDLPDFVRETLQKQYQAVQGAHDRIKDLRDAANNTDDTRSNTARPGVF